MALAVEDGLLGRAAEVDGADDGAVLGVDDGDVGRGVAEDVDAAVEGSAMMPSGLPCTSMVLMVARVLASNMTTGLLVPKPWLDLVSTATPCALALGTSPVGLRVSRSKTVMRPVGPERAMYSLRAAESA